MYQLSFSLDSFLAEFWHKKPTIIKGGFARFEDPISPEELAGLTMEEEVDSRYVSNFDNKWIAEHGPFDEAKFSQLPASHWQLIVQAANHWHEGVAELSHAFKHLPQWLFDDLMICYSETGGGVGPHIDQYDVFIIQGSGKRHWRVGDKDVGQYKETQRAAALRQIEGFDAIIDDILEPGDILYIPPGFPHEGVALEPSMSYSMGYRSPKEQELVSNFADYVLAHDIGDVHLHNPNLKTQAQHGEILSSDLTLLTEMLTRAIEEPDTLKDFMGSMLSQSRHQLALYPPEDVWQSEEISLQLANEVTFMKVSGLRALYNESEPCVAYIDGNMFKVDLEQQDFLHRLCNSDTLSALDFNRPIGSADIALLTDLVNKGYWYCDEQV
ncbi:cupin domain-containing protein [Vibrio genomosp. F10]|uniref:ribosomal protein uL16 3-hydroxylase n=1 Tax=Vibrio genomosp. F10 TaxID=723171 RepID=UPI000307DDF8|nr:cupin domain-containing protein [Vibrio genomosp. F10]OEF08263.1 50S ribosomal protein L16 arginine hydroxylase [Vibrio genomosp. F10 str. 9ZB36]